MWATIRELYPTWAPKAWNFVSLYLPCFEQQQQQQQIYRKKNRKPENSLVIVTEITFNMVPLFSFLLHCFIIWDQLIFLRSLVKMEGFAIDYSIFCAYLGQNHTATWSSSWALKGNETDLEKIGIVPNPLFCGNPFFVGLFASTRSAS